MALLLNEYAITPDVFDITSYSGQEVCGLRLDKIREVVMEEGVVRDLRSGAWRKLFVDGSRPWHARAREIVKKLATQSRLIECPARHPATPANDREWCAEALATHQQEPMTGGVIVTDPVKAAFPGERLVERVDLLSRASWWTGRSPSVRLERNVQDYQRHLGPILRCANSLQFMDPHLDPERPQYRQFASLLASAGGRRPAPLIEVHRVEYVGSGRPRNCPNFEPIFRRKLANTLGAAGLQAEVFIWDHFHDRHLLSNLIGIQLGNGFDTRPGEETTWARLGRKTSDDIRREFDPASRRHQLRTRFTVP